MHWVTDGMSATARVSAPMWQSTQSSPSARCVLWGNWIGCPAKPEARLKAINSVIFHPALIRVPLADNLELYHNRGRSRVLATILVTIAGGKRAAKSDGIA